MTHRTDVARGQEIVARWCSLAEQRLEHLNELFETGRWRRYHSEQAFLENVREARAAVDIWRELLTREASLDNSPIDLSWLGRGTSKLPPRDIAPAAERRSEAAALAEAAMSAVATALETAA
ncbi:TIGR03809 family protein, partial [Bradyrhizobium sp. Pear76]|uniref:TIGR03809 family protein n=1 Tax=Bradyrhizobium oropedii TaxID=1571201 RepID=UPI001E4DDCAE